MLVHKEELIMIRYLLHMKRTGRPMLDPLPIDFGAMYFLYPSESGYMEGFRSTGLRRRLVEKIREYFKREDESKAYRPEKIY